MLTGENSDVYSDKDGNSVWIVTADKKIEKKVHKAFKDAIAWYATNGAPDAFVSMCNNGLTVIFSGVTHPDRTAASVFLNMYGVMWQNMDRKIIRGAKLNNIEISNTSVEPYGINILHVLDALKLSQTVDSLAVVEILKPWMAYFIMSAGPSRNAIYRVLANDFLGIANSKEEEFVYSHNIDLFNRLLILASKVDFIDPIGFSSLNEITEFKQMVDGLAGD